jgi:putative glutamine amidotransferase
MLPPIIGITTYQGKNNQALPLVAVLRAYIDAIAMAGGIPVLIPPTIQVAQVRNLSEKMDGILFTGGGDINPERFNGEAHPRVDGIDIERDSMEMALLEELIRVKKPFLGICRGFQVVNVGLGGALYTDLTDQMPGAIRHDYYPDFPRTLLAHHVNIKKDTFLGSILQEEEIFVNSLHHQGVKSVPEALKTAVYSTDGLAEGVELPGYPFGIAVQWHPEWLTDQPVTRRLFQAFINAAGGKNEGN